MNTIGALVLAMVVALASTALPKPDDSLLLKVREAESLAELERLQAQIQQQMRQQLSLRLTRDVGALGPYFDLAKVASELDQRVTLEATADDHYSRALALASEAIWVRDQSRSRDAVTLKALEEQETLWGEAIAHLRFIPEQSLLWQQAQAKEADYRHIAQLVTIDVDARQSDFLADIAEEAGPADAIRISVCHLSGECRHFQGDIPPASPASLIKLPMAVALMHKVTTENLDLDEAVYIDPHNWTENASGAKIFVDHTYSLREVMVRMIKESNNIATNQLVDYMGWDYINTTLAELGYPGTTVNTKLVGDRTYPTSNRGSGPNTMTTNEVTEMMRQIYTFTHPGDGEILDALVGQYDWDFGYKAVKQLKSERVAWIGEKTGQNSKVIGSTVAVKIDDERYVMTVTVDYSANQQRLRQVIQGVIQHILDDGHFTAPQWQEDEEQKEFTTSRGPA
ncbi:MAG: class A beta-lactamase-related serine hydrolase [Cyanobacteria bacterium]|nr:class A beta-lactamase-related serine hydrolase [Cyanobacteriota bacterium]MDA0865512.1 class A beta-lactamase-related serine hydrolase [Cyanobacteriota bacterium]